MKKLVIIMLVMAVAMTTAEEFRGNVGMVFPYQDGFMIEVEGYTDNNLPVRFHFARGDFDAKTYKELYALALTALASEKEVWVGGDDNGKTDGTALARKMIDANGLSMYK